MITPVFREEFFLDAIINGTTPPDPVFRVEYFLAKIAGADVETPTPIFRIEKYLAKIGGDDVEIPDPVFREEYWLAKKCGENVTTPTPVFRLEYFLEEWVNGSAPAYQSVTGKIVSFITQRIAPLKIEATLEPIQSGTGDPSPENIRPISGHTGAEVYRTGKNILPPTFANGYYDVDNNGAFVPTSNWRASEKIRCLPNTTYYMSGSTYGQGGSSGRIVYWDKYDNYLGYNTNAGANAFTTLANAYKFAFYISSTNITNKMQIELSGVTEYEPYSGTTVTITFGQTVYGGTLTVNEDGTGTVKARPYYASYNGETLVGPWVSSMDAYAPGTTPTTGAQVVDMGGTETTIPLTPGEVNALQGQNVVWVDDSGEIKVTYRSN